ncbi:MAG: MBL fold metallo-hydrolase [Anaerolineae bacterium]|nr:MBL fold metallo-hydrolase [Anaerolineae bacterium]
MFELVFLGTAASAPSAWRNLPSTLVFHDDRRFIVDVGEGTQRQLLKSGVGFKRLNTVLLTHGHLDHILGLGGLISTFARWEAIDAFDIYGGKATLERVRDLMKVVLRGGEVRVKINLIEIEPGVLLRGKGVTVSAFPVNHRGGSSFGFSFEEPDRRPFLVEAAEALGVPAGPERRDLVAGRSVTLASGMTVYPEQVLGPAVPGAKVVYMGDISRTDGLVEAARGADALVTEATYASADADLARDFGHITAAQAAMIAKSAGVRYLYLNHISRRYSGRELEAEARAIFPHSMVVDDLDHFRVTRDGSPQRVARSDEGR